MELSSEQISQLKRDLLVYEAKRWVRFVESGGDNKGQVVEMFQRAVDGRASGEPWCMAAVQYWVKQVDFMMDVFLRQSIMSDLRSKLYLTEHCLTCWKSSDPMCHSFDPIVGSVMIWQKGSTSSGHCGIVISEPFIEENDVNLGSWVYTVEGNTGPSEVVTREGDGVYLKKRHIDGVGNMRVKGWLNPWP